jgi:hypothetical protein
MKVDKETLIKNRFWITLGGICLLVLIALFTLGTSVADDLSNDKKKIDDHRDKVNKSAGAPKLPGKKEFDVLDDKRKALEDRKEIVWKDSWELQNPSDPKAEPLVTWPQRVEERLSPLKFGTVFNSDWILDYTRHEQYTEQQLNSKDGKSGLANLFKVEVPLRPGSKDKSMTIEPVLFRDGWKKRITHVEKWNSRPTTEDVWLAQEDFWVQRELLRALKRANESVSRFTPIADTDKRGEGELHRRSFENPYWRVDLALVKKGQQFAMNGKIKNIGKRRQELKQIFFWVQLNEDGRRVALEVEGESRGVGMEWEFTAPVETFGQPDGILGLEQIFQSATAPVKRIDQIAMGVHSFRTYDPKPLQRPRFSPAPAFAAARGGVTPSPSEARGDDKTENGLVRPRYLDQTDQVRRMPLGLVLIVDQAHVPEVLSALTNCRLRLQITQVNLQHFRGVIKSDEKRDPKGPVTPAPRPDDEQAANNLVELSVYGIASLCERLPAKPAAAAKDR